MSTSKLSKARFARIMASHRDWLESGSTRGVCADFTGKDLRKVPFEKYAADWAYAELDGCDLSGVSARQIEGRSINLGNVKAVRAEFIGSNLELAYMKCGDFTGASFYKAQVPLAQMQDGTFCESSFSDANLENANAEGADFSNSNMMYTNFHKALLKDVKFDGATLCFANGNGKEICSLQWKEKHVVWWKSGQEIMVAVDYAQHPLDVWENSNDFNFWRVNSLKLLPLILASFKE